MAQATAACQHSPPTTQSTMNRGTKEPTSRRRTIAVSVPLTGTGTSGKEKTQANKSSSSITSFFFGQKTKSNTAIATVLSNKSNDSTSNKSNSESGKGSRPSSFNLLRVNSNASVSTIASKNSVSSMGSFRDSRKGSVVDNSPQPIPRTMSSNDDMEKAEHMAISVSMKLNLWEATDANSQRSSTKRTELKGKRSLNRDNSAGSNVSHISNISNNSNISILSNLSGDSRKSSSSPKNGSSGGLLVPQTYNAAAVAAANRARFFGTSSPTPVGSSTDHAGRADHGGHPTSLAAASHELQLSSAENSPMQSRPHTPRTVSNSSVEADTVVSEQGPVPEPVPVPAPASVKPVLKKMSMEALPNRREGLQRARNSWVQAAVTEGVRPKMVKFTSSTKSMGELLQRESSREGREALVVSAFMQVGAKLSAQQEEKGEQQKSKENTVPVAAATVGSSGGDILIEGATIVEEEDEDAAEVVAAEAPVEAPVGAPVEEPVENPVEASTGVLEKQRQLLEPVAPTTESPPPKQQQQQQQQSAVATPSPAPSPANPVRVALRQTMPGGAGSSNTNLNTLEKHGSSGGLLVMPALSPVPVVHKVVTPARVEFVEVKLKPTDSSVNVTGDIAGAAAEESSGNSSKGNDRSDTQDADAEPEQVCNGPFSNELCNILNYFIFPLSCFLQTAPRYPGRPARAIVGAGEPQRLQAVRRPAQQGAGGVPH